MYTDEFAKKNRTIECRTIDSKMENKYNDLNI